MTVSVLTRTQAWRSRPVDAVVAWFSLVGVDAAGVARTFEWSQIPVSNTTTALESRVLSFGAGTSQLSDLDGKVNGASFVVSIVDTDNEARSWLTNVFQKALLNREGMLQVQTYEDFLAGIDPVIVFQGKVKDYKPISGGTFQFTLQGWLDAIIGQNLTLPRIGAAFPNAPEASRDLKGRRVYGRHSDDPSATASPLAEIETDSGATDTTPAVPGIGHMRDADGNILAGPGSHVVAEAAAAGNFLIGDVPYGMARKRVNGRWSDATPFLHFDTGTSITIGANGSGVKQTCALDPAADLYRFHLGILSFGTIRWDQYLDTVDPVTGVVFTDAPGAGGQLIGNLPQVLTASAGHHEFEAQGEYDVQGDMVDGWTPAGTGGASQWQSIQQPFRAGVRLVWGALVGARRYRVRKRAPGGTWSRVWFVETTSTNDDGNVVWEDDQLDTDVTYLTDSLDPKGVIPCRPLGPIKDKTGVSWEAFEVGAHACKAILNLYLNERTLLTAAEPATAEIGSLTDTVNSRVTITAGTPGVIGNALAVRVEAGVGLSQPLTITVVDNVLTVTLATDGAGAPNNAANTSDLVAAAIDAEVAYSAATSGTDVVQPDDDQRFSGGAEATYDTANRTIAIVGAGRYGVDVAAPGKSGFSTYFDSVYLDAENETRWCPVYVRGSDGALLADGTTTLWANVEGIEDVGDGSGDLVEELLDQKAHVEDNFVLPPASWSAGPWFSLALWSDGRPKRDAASYTAAKIARAAHLSDTAGAFIISASANGTEDPRGNSNEDSDVPIIDLLAWLAVSADVRQSDASGALRVVFDTPDSTAPAPVESHTETLDMADGSLDVEPMTGLQWFWNQRTYEYLPLYAMDGTSSYAGQAIAKDDASIATFGLRASTSTVSFFALRSFSAARDVSARQLARAKDGVTRVSWETGLSALMLQLGDIVPITNRGGLGRSGYDRQHVQVDASTPMLDAGTVRLEGRDLLFSEGAAAAAIAVPAGSLAFSGFGDAPMAFLSASGATLTFPMALPECGSGCNGVIALKGSSKIAQVGGGSPNFGTFAVGVFSTDFRTATEGDTVVGNGIARDDAGNFYGASSTRFLYRFNSAGVMTGAWNLGGGAGTHAIAIAVNGAGTIAYFVRANARDTVKAWDLIGDASLGTFVTRATYQVSAGASMCALSNGEVIVGWKKTGASGDVKRYSAAAATLGTVTLTGTNPAPIVVTPGLTEATVWVGYYRDDLATSSEVTIAEIDVATAALIGTPFNPDDGAGFEFDGGFCVLRAAVATLTGVRATAMNAGLTRATILDVSQDWTREFDVLLIGTPADGDYRTYWTTDPEYLDDWIWLGSSVDTNDLMLGVLTGGGGDIYTTPLALATDVLHRMKVTYDAGTTTLTLFVNGVMVDTLVADLATFAPTTHIDRLGTDPGSTSPLVQLVLRQERTTQNAVVISNAPLSSASDLVDAESGNNFTAVGTLVDWP